MLRFFILAMLPMPVSVARPQELRQPVMTNLLGEGNERARDILPT